MDPEEDTKELSLIERLKAERLKAEGGQQNSAEEVSEEPVEVQADIQGGTDTPTGNDSSEAFSDALAEAAAEREAMAMMSKFAPNCAKGLPNAVRLKLRLHISSSAASA